MVVWGREEGEHQEERIFFGGGWVVKVGEMITWLVVRLECTS